MSDDLLWIFYPTLCAACDRPLLMGEECLCTFCKYYLPRTHFHLQSINPVAKHFWGKVPIQAATSYYYFSKGEKVQRLIHKLKYKHMNAPLSDILYNFDEVFASTKKPLFVFEGFFDGMSLCSKNFVSIQSSNLTREQIYFLSLSKRTKIIVPDMQNNGGELIQQGIDNNYQISFPTLKGCKDVNEAVIKYGKLFVLKNIFDNVVSGDDAKLRLNMLKFGI